MASTTLRDYLQYTEDAISTGRIEDALAQCQRILSHFPESLEAQRLLGEVYLAQEQLEEAQQAFDWILTNDPENVVVYCDRALICERMSDYDTALDCYQQAYELSRGNSQIRHEFNKLSTRVGQQGFMLSRAGLARLYMRGDLLPQAIQEWEAVLSVSPDRLDARTGLLEAYWREGLFEQVEELANAILNDVPGCLKALLLLAHVTSLKDMQRAEELIQRAEMLDPELVMAQELFSDLIANQPLDPFLQLLKREAVVLPEPLSSPAPPEASDWSAQSTQIATNGTHSPSSSPPGALFSWSSLGPLLDVPQQQEQPEQDVPTFAWPSNSALDINPWSTIDQLAGPVVEPASAARPVTESEAGAAKQHTEPFTAQEAEKPTADVQPAWSQADQMVEPVADASGTWSGTMSQNEVVPDANESAWATEVREEAALPTPPAWLDMLTKGGRPQPSSTPSAPLSNTGSVAEASTSEAEVRSASPASRPLGPLFAEPAAPARMPWENDLQPVPVSEGDEGENLSFGPEWLKSLGAEVLEQGASDAANPIEPVASLGEELPPTATIPSHNSDFWQEAAIDPWSNQEAGQTQQEAPVQSWLEQLNASPSTWQTPIDPWMEQSAQPAQPTPPSIEMQQVPGAPWPETVAEPVRQQQEPDIPTAEQQFATLEILERDLYAQGFVPLEPGSLAKIAEEESLSTALAQFGSEPLPRSPYEEQPAQSWQQPEQAALVAQPEAQTLTSGAQPEARQSAPAQPAVQFYEPVEEPLWTATAAGPASNPTLDPVSEAEVTIQQSSRRTGAISQPVLPVPPADAVVQPAQAAQTAPAVPPVPKKPAASNDSSLDELELTMRRPVVRLQPATQKTANLPGQAPTTPARSRSGTANRAEDSSMSYKERLRKGYHHQLAGDYDEAMQEYRVIIRNAPELLGEVVSNMRALLKLAPRYAPGYRVLGDAYMRQGEYLQAMEAYNKALMMAKKGVQGQTQEQR